ncbi:MAG: ATP-binding cassette domain-containing protein [Thermodesulfobacteriota bacterium]
MTPLLEVSGLSGGYGPIRIFRDVSFTVENQTNVGLFGPNGHGKTTLLKTISGILDPFEGSVTFLGKRLNRPEGYKRRSSRNFNYDALRRRAVHPPRVVELGLIHVPQGNLLFPELTIHETLQLAGGFRWNQDKAKETREFVEDLFPVLWERRLQKIKSLSGGERQMVAIASGLMGQPKLLILDEPTLGLAPKVRYELGGAIKAIKATGVPIILVEQDIELLINLVDKLHLFNHGAISPPLDKSTMPDHGEILDMYFGGTRS